MSKIFNCNVDFNGDVRIRGRLIVEEPWTLRVMDEVGNVIDMWEGVYSNIFVGYRFWLGESFREVAVIVGTDFSSRTVTVVTKPCQDDNCKSPTLTNTNPCDNIPLSNPDFSD